MVDGSVIVSIKRYLCILQEYGLTPSFGVLFGSHVTGGVHEWSDIDLMVVAERYDQDYRHEDVALLWKVAGRVDPRIEPIPCGEKQWEEDDGIPIIEIARREGVRIEIEDEN